MSKTRRGILRLLVIEGKEVERIHMTYTESHDSNLPYKAKRRMHIAKGKKRKTK